MAHFYTILESSQKPVQLCLWSNEHIAQQCPHPFVLPDLSELSGSEEMLADFSFHAFLKSSIEIKTIEK